MQVVLELTEEQADLLDLTLSWSTDCGPGSGGWQSPELARLCSIVTEATEKAKNK